MSGFRGFASSLDGRLTVPRPLWDKHRKEITKLYLEDRRSLQEVMRLMASKGLPKTKKPWLIKLHDWNISKNKRKQTQRSPDPMAAIWSRGPARCQEIILSRLGAMLVVDLGILAADSGLPIETALYEDSNLYNSIIDMNFSYDTAWKPCEQDQDFRPKAFETITKIFHQHSLYAMLHLLHSSFGYGFNRDFAGVWKHLYNESCEKWATIHPLHDILLQLVALSSDAEWALNYEETLRDTMKMLSFDFKAKGAHQDPTLLWLMTRGESYLPQHFKLYIANDMEQTRLSTRAKFGIHFVDYWDHLWRHLEGFAELFGSDSDEVFLLACDILYENEKLEEEEPGLFYLCRRAQAWHQWRRWEEMPQVFNPQCEFAVFWMDKCTRHRQDIGLMDPQLVSDLEKLASWQSRLGLEMDAEETQKRYESVIEDLSSLDLRD